MSLNMILSQSKKQAESAKYVCTEIMEAMQKVIESIEALVENDNLQGVTYNSAKSYMENTYKVLAEATISLCCELIVQNKLIYTSFEAEVSTNDVIELQVEEQIRMVDNLFYTFGDDMAKIDGADTLFDILEQTKRQLQGKLDLLYQFNYTSKDNFEYANELISNIARGIEEVQSNRGYDLETGTYSTASLDMSWSKGMDENLNPYLIDVPEGMNEEEYKAYKNVVLSQIKQLEADGWDSAAINGYLKELSKVIIKENAEVELTKYGQQMKMVGSDVYLLLFKNSKKTDVQKVTLVLTQMGAKIDENGMLQLTGYLFDPKMPPHDEFLNLFAKSVQGAYKEKPLPKEVHQFRMYIDKHNIEYIRANYGEGKTDEEALEAYVNKELKGEKMFREDARYHNKFPVALPPYPTSLEDLNRSDQQKYDEYWAGHENRKRVSQDFHSEYILDENGTFVSQWNVLSVNNGMVDSNPDNYVHNENFENQMTNGSSFNYADENDTGSDNSVHDHLDVEPPQTLDPEIRDDVNWISPSDQFYDYKSDNQEDSYSIWENTGTNKRR